MSPETREVLTALADAAEAMAHARPTKSEGTRTSTGWTVTCGNLPDPGLMAASRSLRRSLANTEGEMDKPRPIHTGGDFST